MEVSFIGYKNLKKLILETVEKYEKQQKNYDLPKFNSRIVDPIKLMFDAKIGRKNFEQVIKDEISRQKDKSNNNIIGYFHQQIFKHIHGCIVPKQGFDIIFEKNNLKMYIELKNKHNTMNSSSSKTVYEKFLEQINREPKCICALVEVIAKKSQNIPWHINGKVNERIRKISIDRFYEIVTEDTNAFFNLCKTIPKVLDEIMIKKPTNLESENKVIEELRKNNNQIEEALFDMSFKTYLGFKK